ncbi:WGR and DUF4132 domain-containing protein [Escherichia albertii]|uniref:WGR and DUF4132 domain-containing protein n=2 Tax=Escherichia albertii TaxID=208962 RepID=UPI0010F7AAB4|nr:WGR and DUF4132 domain-containing protein [Escherichia albertii]MCZ8571187.1 WGR and DUF4132 domain-containing protein [Escherichia albertii]MCZ8847531.1 WGR and DUF4132 domain-containing protein [Escherichia albertii]
MKIYIYQDEKSHKFWAVEQQGNELHISWGKVGTNGQSQVKSFADAAAAEKAELKLIAEKVKKGYEEEQETTAASEISPAEIPLVTEARSALNAVTILPVTNAAAPWLADNAPIILPKHIARYALSHRRWPGEPIALPTQPEKKNLISRMANSVSGFCKNLTFDYSSCPFEWSEAIAQAFSFINTPKPVISARIMAVLARIGISFGQQWNNDTSSELLDEIVQTYGLEYATEVVIYRWQLALDFDYRNKHITFFLNDAMTNRRSLFHKFDIRLRKHLSLAEETVWQSCIAKLLIALPDISHQYQPLVACLIPELPDIAHEIAQRLSAKANIPELAELKMVATDPQVLEIIMQYQTPTAFGGYLWCVTVVREQGIAALARLIPHADEDQCGNLLIYINHPLAVTALIQAADTNKRCYERLIKIVESFPAASLVALTEALAQKEDKRKHTLLASLLNAHPNLGERIIARLSPQAAIILEQCQQQLKRGKTIDCASSDELPSVLVSPPWLTKPQKSTIPVLNLTILSLAAFALPMPDLSTAKTFLLSRGIQIALLDANEQLPRTTSEILQHLGFSSSRSAISDGAITAYEQSDYAQLITEWRMNHSPNTDIWKLRILARLQQNKAIELWNVLSMESHTNIEEVMKAFGLDALPGFINSLARETQEAMPVAQYFAAVELAPPVAYAFNELKTLRSEARTWLLKYPEHAITGLLPAALGKVGEAQDNARAALRLLVENGHQPLLKQVAQRYNQPEVMDAVSVLLSLDPLDNHPTKIPTLPIFYQPVLWRHPTLINGKMLPDAALNHLGEMLRFPQEEALYPGLLQVKDACTSDSLAEFAWDLFTAWQTAGAPSKESWAFTALGVLGNDDTARKLTPLIRAWPGESQHKRATVGLDILAAIGSDIALMQLNGIAQKLKFKALQERAKEKIADIAKSRELTVAELEDRLAPDLGLDDNGSLLLDFGPRQFTVSFDETLKPFVRDASGSRLKDLPKPNKSDDESQANDAVNRYKLLKKDARTVAAQQVARLESAMCLRRRWSPENFLLFLVEHPLIRYLTRRLIWGVYSADNQLQTCFRVAEDNSYSTADDDLFTLPEGDMSIGIPHILEISPIDAAAFGQLFADYELLPPFRQLGRNSYHLTEAEHNASELTRWAGRKCPSGRVMGLANKGWIRGEPQDGGWIGWMIKPLGRWSLIMEINEGFAVGMSPAELSAEQLLSKIWLWDGKAENYGWGSNTSQEMQFSALDDITASELINDIESLFD